MNQYEAATAIYQRWIDTWPAASAVWSGIPGGVPYVFDNDVAADAAMYARVMIEFDNNPEQHTLGAVGNRMFRCPGQIVVMLRAPLAEGSKRGHLAADTIRAVYQSQRLGRGVISGVVDEGLETFVSASEVLEPDGDHWILVSATPFNYYDRR